MSDKRIFCESESPIRDDIHASITGVRITCQLRAGHNGLHWYDDELTHHEWDGRDPPQQAAARRRPVVLGGFTSPRRYWWGARAV